MKPCRPVVPKSNWPFPTVAFLLLVGGVLSLGLPACSSPPELRETHQLEAVAVAKSIEKKRELYDAALQDFSDVSKRWAISEFKAALKEKKDSNGRVAEADVLLELEGKEMKIVDPNTGEVTERYVGGLLAGFRRTDASVKKAKDKWDAIDPNLVVFYDLHGTVAEFLGRTGISQEQQDAIMREAVENAQTLRAKESD